MLPPRNATPWCGGDDGGGDGGGGVGGGGDGGGGGGDGGCGDGGGDGGCGDGGGKAAAAFFFRISKNCPKKPSKGVNNFE